MATLQQHAHAWPSLKISYQECATSVGERREAKAHDNREAEKRGWFLKSFGIVDIFGGF